MTPAAITLYDTPGSPCARRVRIVLLEKGLSWTTRILCGFPRQRDGIPAPPTSAASRSP